MKEIIALQEYTDKYVSLYEGQIRNLANGIADTLIDQGIVAQHNGGGGDEEPEFTFLLGQGASGFSVVTPLDEALAFCRKNLKSKNVKVQIAGGIPLPSNIYLYEGQYYYNPSQEADSGSYTWVFDMITIPSTPNSTISNITRYYIRIKLSGNGYETPEMIGTQIYPATT